MGIAVLVGSIALIVWAVWHFSADMQIRRQLRKAPAKRIGDLHDDELGKVVGRVRCLSEALVGPLTGRRCVYFVVIVEERRRRAKSSHWKTIIKESRGVPFMLEDDSGRALVDATAARISVEFDGKSASGTFDDPTDNERAFLARHGEEGQGWILNRTLRYREAVIEDGEMIAVLGAGTREPDPDAPPAEAYRGEMPTRVRLTSSRKYPLVISDHASTLRG